MSLLESPLSSGRPLASGAAPLAVHILIATTEAVPFAKTGGLADVCGTLPLELAKLGHHPTLIMPAFREIQRAGLEIEPTGIDVDVPIGNKTVRGTILQSHLPDSDIPVYFIQKEQYYDRDELYRENGQDYKDNCERFVFFSRAVLEAIRLLDLKVDVLHCNDWQAGLIPAYQKIEYQTRPHYENIATLLTIHNMAYQGIFWHWDMALTGLDWKYFNWKQLEFYGNLNLLKTGLAFADAINTVSPRYAEEITSAPLGCGLEGMLQYRRKDLSGIINGVDYRMWDPATDQSLAANYDVNTVEEGKPRCKAALQQQFGLPQIANVPVVGIVGRLAEQKGCDLAAQVIQEWVQTSPVQWVILGTGEPKYHELFALLAQRYPQKVSVQLEFSEAVAHQIEAGADMFLMPSRYEPCGLNQLYSLRYGTVPVVRATGGLADTITDATPENLAAGRANGFSFGEASSLALSETLRRACDMYHQRQQWRQVVSTGMRQDWSWAHSARQYSSLYDQITTRAKQPALV